MIVNSENLAAIYFGVSKAFQQAMEGAKPVWKDLATTVPSGTREERYAWLGQFPRLREWIGERIVSNLSAYEYTIKNRKFESTIEIPREDIEDDSYGIFAPLFKELGFAAATHPDELLFELIGNGFTQACYDGMSFFSKTHPVKTKDGAAVASNVQVADPALGPQSPWFLLDTTRALKPFIFQLRRDYELRAMVNPEDERVFMEDQFRYGVDARVNVGFGFWQQAFGSQLPLTADNFNAAYTAMTSLTSDEGRPLGIKPNLLLCGMSNRQAAFYIAKADRLEGNVPNPNYQIVDVTTTPYLP